MALEQVDLLIIGAGQAAPPLAYAFAKAGQQVALVECEHVGGTCINEGCTPTKTMIASARVAYLARRSADYGVLSGDVSVDLAQVRERKRSIVEAWRERSHNSLEDAENIELIMGEARFTAPKTVEVKLNQGSTRTLTAETVVINTGERPRIPEIEGLEQVEYLNSTTVMELADVPQHLIVIGGGYVGLEFAQMFRRFGSEVTIIQRGAQLLGREDADVAEAVADILRADKIHIFLNTSPTRIENREGMINIQLDRPEEASSVAGSHLLIATGRQPNTEKLNLEAAGIRTDKHGYVEIDQHLQTSVEGVYAVGDVKGGPAFTHISYDDYRILEARLLKGENASTKERLVPYTVFIDPQLGRIGLSESQAREQNIEYKVAQMPMSNVARAAEMDETRGMMKVLIDAHSDHILGCAILGVEGGELMSALQIAMLGKLPYTTLRDATFAHPTLTESFNNLFAQIEAP